MRYHLLSLKETFSTTQHLSHVGRPHFLTKYPKNWAKGFKSLTPPILEVNMFAENLSSILGSQLSPTSCA